MKENTTWSFIVKKWEVTYKLKETGSKYHKRIVEATTQFEARALAHCEMPSAILCGNPRPL